ncbi:MAG: helix-turn-helix domain-containing protein [Thermoplasmatales archaeon]
MISRKPESDIQTEIIKLLKKNKEARFTEIKNTLNVSKPTLSYHLYILLNEKAIEFERKGREKIYKLSDIKPKKFKRQVERLSINYTDHLFLSNPSVTPKTPTKIIDEISNNVSAFFLFMILKSIQTGKNWSKAFDTKEMVWVSTDLLSYTLFGKNVDHNVLENYAVEGEDKFFKKVYQLSKDLKNEPLINSLMKYLQEKFPVEFKILEQIYEEITSKKN